MFLPPSLDLQRPVCLPRPPPPPPCSPWSFSYGRRVLGVNPGPPTPPSTRGDPFGEKLEKPGLCGRRKQRPQASAVLSHWLQCHRGSPSGLHSETTPAAGKFSLTTTTKIAPP